MISTLATTRMILLLYVINIVIAYAEDKHDVSYVTTNKQNLRAYRSIIKSKEQKLHNNDRALGETNFTITDIFKILNVEFPVIIDMMSMTYSPSDSPSDMPSDQNTIIVDPSISPVTASSSQPSNVMSASPTMEPPTSSPTISIVTFEPTTAPSKSAVPPTIAPSKSAVPPTTAPTVDAVEPTSRPTVVVTAVPSSTPTGVPVAITEAPIIISTEPSYLPTKSPIPQTPESLNCPGITEQERIDQIYDILGTVSTQSKLRNRNIPQGLATRWIIDNDNYKLCPNDTKFIQRWTLAVMYYSTGGDNWLQCSDPKINSTDNCGTEIPFVGDKRFLSSVNECEWAGISCIDDYVTEIEYGT